MTLAAQKSLKLFCSYARDDEGYVKELRTSLITLERQRLIEWWHDREIVPGSEWEEAIAQNLETADVIILLVSRDSMASNYVYEQEIRRAIERHDRSQALVIPVIVRPSLWKEESFAKLQALPTDAKPISTWDDQDQAWLDVANGIEKAVKDLANKLSKYDKVDDQVRSELIDRSQTQFQSRPQEKEGFSYFLEGQSAQRTRRPELPSSAQLRREFGSIEAKGEINRGVTLPSPRQPQEVYDPVIINRLDNRANTQYQEGQFAEALKNYDVALYLYPHDPVAWYLKGLMLAKLGLHDKALDAFREAAARKQNHLEAWRAVLGNDSRENGVA
jgi:tetratricopeptide (TPR) repeat protein